MQMIRGWVPLLNSHPLEDSIHAGEAMAGKSNRWRRQQQKNTQVFVFGRSESFDIFLKSINKNSGGNKIVGYSLVFILLSDSCEPHHLPDTEGLKDWISQGGSKASVTCGAPL